MSVKALTWAFERQVGDPIAKLLLIALADFANEQWDCTPSRKTLALYAECSIDTVDRRLNDLVRRGYISKEARKSKKGDATSNIYHLIQGVGEVAARVAANGGHVAAELSGHRGRRGAATMVNHPSDPPSNQDPDAPDLIEDDEPAKPSSKLTKMQEFDSFWTAYPRKVGKVAAQKAFAKVKEPTLKLIEAVERAKRSDGWVRDGGQYIPHASTWLNGERWNDELKTYQPNGNTKHYTQGAGGSAGTLNANAVSQY